MELSRLLELLKLKPETLLGILLGSGVLVILPESALAKLGLLVFVSAFRGWLGGALVLSTALLLASGLSVSLRQGRRYVTEFIESRTRRESFKYLSPSEKKLLARYLEEQTQTQYLDIRDGVANGLQAKGFIYRASSVGANYTSFAFNIQPWAWKCLHDSPGLVIYDAEEDDK
jgi:hypothetical protein